MTRVAAMVLLLCGQVWAGADDADDADEAAMVPHTRRWHVRLERLPPERVLEKLDLDRPGLETVKAAHARGDRQAALAALLEYYRGRFPPPAGEAPTGKKFTSADRICDHIFQWGPYPPHDYGPDIDWTLDPADDIEWVAAMYRFIWAEDLRTAYLATRDEKYARAFVELTRHWIEKHPLDDWTRTHPTLTRWKGFAWLDLQTGIRATRAVAAFTAMVHAEAITPEFLGIFLASMYDHQHKTDRVPMGMVHNKAIFEQRGVLNVCNAFPEFAETQRWARRAVARSRQNLLAQTTPEGVQREWCGGYHLAVLRDAIEIMEQGQALGITIPEDYRERTRLMCEYVFWLATPDLAWPMFGDTARPHPPREQGPLTDHLLRFGKLWDDPRYEARARGDAQRLPQEGSRAFETAGIYVMRSDWGREGIYLALHCAPPAISSHDHPDNGTFELYAFGRWLMTDSGFYTYGHDRAAREWHRQTRVHQTLTLDGKDTNVAGRLRLWHASPGLDALVVENDSYEGLVHRRTVWFVDRSFFVFLDEAIGQADGELRLHWTPAVGEGGLDEARRAYTTRLGDANVLIQAAAPESLRFETEPGWFAWEYGRRQERTALVARHPQAAPAAFLTVVVPYRGSAAPSASASFVVPQEPAGAKPPVPAGAERPAAVGADQSAAVGAERVEVSVQVQDQHWRLGRDLTTRTAWSERRSK